MINLTLDQNLIKNIINLTLPVWITQLCAVGRFFIATIFISYLGETPLATLSISTSIIETTILIAMGFLSGVALLSARGFDSIVEIKNFLYSGFLISLILSILIIVILYNFDLIAPFLHFKKTLIVPLISALQIYSYGVTPFILATMIRFYLLGIEKSAVIAINNLLGLIITVTLSYIFIFGKLGIPRMGLNGFFWSMVISFWIIFLLLLFHLWKILIHQKQNGNIIKNNGKFNFKKEYYFKHIIKYGFPQSIMYGAESLFITILVYFIQYYGVQYVAGYQIANQINLLIIMFIFAVSQAVIVIANKKISEFTYKKITIHASLIACSFIVICSLGILVNREQILSFYFNTKELQAIGLNFLYLNLLLLLPIAFKDIFFAILYTLNKRISAMMILLFANFGIGLLLCILTFLFITNVSPLIYIWIELFSILVCTFLYFKKIKIFF